MDILFHTSKHAMKSKKILTKILNHYLSLKNSHKSSSEIEMKDANKFMCYEYGTIDALVLKDENFFRLRREFKTPVN